MKTILTCLLILSAATVHADAGFVLARDAISASGGGVTAGVTFLGLTVGEPVIGTERATDWAMTQGFWALVTPAAPVDVPRDACEGALQFALRPVAPNPSDGNATIRFVIPAAGAVRVTIRLFDISGRLVRVLEDGPRPPGVHAVSWDGTNRSGARAGAGLYLCHMQAGGFVATRRLVVIR